MGTPSRRQLLGLGLASAMAPAWVRHARAQDLARFALGVASGQPQPTGMVLWTMLTGPNLPERVEVQWEVAHDEAFTRIAAKGVEVAEVAWAHSVHAEPRGLDSARWYFYRFRALGQQSAVARTRTAPAPDAAGQTLKFAIASCQRYDMGHYAAWKHAATDGLDLVMFLGDYIYEYSSRPDALRRHQGGLVRTLSDYRQRYAQYKTDPHLQAAHAAAPWLLVWDDHDVDNDYANLVGQSLQPDFERQRAAAYQAYWEHMPFPKSARPRGPDMRIINRFQWGQLATIHAVDDRQYRDQQVCPKPGRAGSNTLSVKDCPAFLDAKRTLLGRDQEAWLAQGWDTERRWNLLAQQTLMARFSWSDPAADGGGTYWTDGWDGYAPARNRLLGAVAERQIRNAVVLGGDVHSNYVADLKANYDDPKSAVVATEFCGTSITSLGLAQERVDAARAFNPHIRYARSDERGYVRFELTDKQLMAELQVVQDIKDPNSAMRTAARFAVDPTQPGAQAA